MLCTNCLEEEYTTGKTELTVTINGEKHILRDLDCETCPACGDISFTHVQSLEIDKKRIALEFGVKTLLTPAQGIKFLLRTSLNGFPDVMIHAAEPVVKKHPRYSAAKSGDVEAAQGLVRDTINDEQVAALRHFVIGRTPILVSVHAYESEGVNAIPEALADALSIRLGLETDAGIVQTNVVMHTGADGYGRLARPPIFDGDVVPGAEYVLVDDFVGQGGTLANLRGFIEARGGSVSAAVTLTGKPYSAKLALQKTQLDELRQKHGDEFEKWWQKRFGYTFDCLTQSEARYLARSPDAGTIRNRIAAAE
jgi:hypothetical protein